MKKIYFGVVLLLFSFVAQAQFPAPYCAEAFSAGVEPITSVVFNTINNTSSATTTNSAHENFTTISTSVTKGLSYTMAVKGNTDGGYSDGVVAFIDFNNNGVFTDAGESFNIGVLTNSTGTDATVVSNSIAIPATAITGSVRMRVSKRYNAYPIPCNTTGFGQAEDYTLSIVAPACSLPSNLQFSNVTIPNATITWTAAQGVTSYQYAITNSATPPVSGIATSATTATVGSLPAGSALFAYVRSVCSTGVFTEWIKKTYIPCTTNVTPASGATNVGIPTTFNWTAINGVSSYQILLSTDNGVTYGLSGVFVAPPAANVTGLSYNTTYRWYVRGIVGSDTAATTCATANATNFTTAATPTPPANDNCAGAITLTPGAVTNGTNINATQSLAPASCTGSTSDGALDVWYRITAQFSGPLTITVAGATPLDAVLAAYSGTCASPSLIMCNDSTSSGGTENLTITNAVAGTTYLFRVYGWYVSQGSDSTGTFTIRATGGALPVTGVNLAATRNGKNVQLGWQTLTEANNSGFELQRSADGSSFTSFLKVASKAKDGNSTSAINYAADDVKPFSGANYYRLKQTDKDGKISYSNIAYLKGQAVSNLTLSAIYPNPTRDVLKAAVQSPTAEKITFIITDMTGKAISRIATTVTSGDNTISLNVANLPSGNYLLKAICTNGCETAVQKFTKQ